MRIASGVTDQYIYFVAVDSTDFTTRETGLSSFTVYRSRNGAAAAAYTTPTINETSASNMPGVYELLVDEDMTIDSGDETQEFVLHITHAGMAPVTRTIELYRPKITAGNTLGVAADGDISGNVDGTLATVTTLTNLPAITTNWLTATGTDSGAVTKIQAGLATPTNITAGTITTATNLTNLPAIPTNWLTAAGIAASALDAKGDWNTTVPSNLTAAQIATGVWQNTTAGDFTVASSVGKSVMNGVSLGTGLTVAAVSGAVGSVTGAVGSVTGHTPQTGDSFARIGAPTGASVSADTAAIKTDTAAILVDTSVIGAAGAGLTDLGGMSTSMKAEVNAEADTAITDYDPPTNTEMVAAFTEIKGATFAATDTLEAIRNRGDAAWGTATGFSTHSAADVATTQMTQSYAAKGAVPSPAQILFEMRSWLVEKGVSGTTVTTQKIDGSTTAATYTIDDATEPTDVTRTS